MVVLDECHDTNDSQRGTVWKESIIHCPPSIQLVIIDGLSFYVQVFPFSWWRNPREGSARWMAAVRWGAFWAQASTVFGLERGSKFLNPVGVTIGIKRKANSDLS